MDSISSYLASHFNEPKVTKTQTVQTLWSDYGEIARYFLPTRQQYVIVKHISPPAITRHPKGWNTAQSHLRKLTSYEVECRFYDDYSGHCQMPFYSAKRLGGLCENGTLCIVMEDLDQLGYAHRTMCPSPVQIRSVLKWLGYFHGRFINHSTDGLWEQGSYWHLATRPDEYQAMAHGKLKEKAYELDEKLRCASYQTLVHGDAKVANFCFGQQAKVAAVDFQYVGKGVGVVDLAYFLGSCLDQQQLFDHAQQYCQWYFEYLSQALNQFHPDLDDEAIIRQWQNLYSIAWADFHRFLAGWSPEHSKRNDYMDWQTGLALQQL